MIHPLITYIFKMVFAFLISIILFIVNYTDLAMKVLESDRALATARNGKRETALHILARMPSEFVSQSPGMWSRLMDSCELIL
jgi:hypothetical protein